jgi:hypothetical protein
MAVSEVLTTRQIDSFIDQGFCTVCGAFTAAQAAAARQRVWRRMEVKAGILESDPSTWPPNYDIEEHLDHPEVKDCFTDRLAAANEQLVGPGRWRRIRSWGLWPVNFSYGADRAEDYPSRGWHVDGNWFPHTIDSPYPGAAGHRAFHRYQPGWGGTILALGSHKRTARVLAHQRRPIHHRDLFREVLREPIGNFHEITGAAGDVVLAHPFLFHTRGFKRAGPPRIISNTEAGLTRPLQFNRRNLPEYSVRELSILAALLEPLEPPRGAKMCGF